MYKNSKLVLLLFYYTNAHVFPFRCYLFRHVCWYSCMLCTQGYIHYVLLHIRLVVEQALFEVTNSLYLYWIVCYLFCNCICKCTRLLLDMYLHCGGLDLLSSFRGSVVSNSTCCFLVLGFLHGVRGEITDDVSETAVVGTFISHIVQTPQNQNTTFISRWKSNIKTNPICNPSLIACGGLCYNARLTQKARSWTLALPFFRKRRCLGLDLETAVFTVSEIIRDLWFSQWSVRERPDDCVKESIFGWLE